MIEHKNIQEALHGVYSEVGYVQKQKSAGLNYSFAGESEFIQEIRPALINHGITMYVKSMDDLRNETYTTKNGSVMMRSIVHATVRFQHVTQTYVDVEAYGEGSDTGDKSVNKAMTDCYKYALRQTFMIATGDDPDKEASQERKQIVSEDAKSKKVDFTPKNLVDAAKQEGAVEKSKMSLEMAKTAVSHDGKKYCEMEKKELVNHLNGLLDKKAKKPGEFTEDDLFKLDAALVLMKVEAKG